MKEPINERVKIIVESLNITANAFANELDVAGSVIYNIIKGRNKPSFDILDKMVSRFNVNPNFLLTGKGDMFLTTDERIEKILTDRDPDEDEAYFFKQWIRIIKIVENAGVYKVHDFFESIQYMFSKIANILEHYSLMKQSLSFLNFAPKTITHDALKEQVKKMVEFEVELAKISHPYIEILNELYKKMETFNEKHDNLYHRDDEYFEEILKDVELEFKAKK